MPGPFRLPRFAAFAIAFAALAPGLEANPAKPLYRNGEPVEGQQTDGNWYAGSIWKFDKAKALYQIRWKGVPTSADSWLDEAKLRKAGSGPVADPASFPGLAAAPQPSAATRPGPAPAAASAAPAGYGNGAAVEAQQADGRWYAGRVYKVDKSAGTYMIRFDGLPTGADAWLTADKLRPPGGGDVVDPAHLMSELQFRREFAELDAHAAKGQWTDSHWLSDLDRHLKTLREHLASHETRWPQANNAPIRGGLERRVAEYAGKRPEVPAPLTPEEATALEEAYRPRYEAARQFPHEADASGLVGMAATLEALDLARFETRLAADRTRFPSFFKYYGMEEKGRYGDLPWGGNRRPDLGGPLAEKISTFYLPAIFEARAKLDRHPGGPAGAIEMAIQAGSEPEGAKAAVRLAKALMATRPGASGLAAALASAESHLAAVEKAQAERAASKAAAAAAPSAPAAKAKAPVVDPSEITSGVTLSFSKRSTPGAPAETSFSAGDPIYLHAKFPGPILRSLKNPVITDQVHFVVYLDLGDTELDYTSASVRYVHIRAEAEAEIGNAGYLTIPIASDPAQDCYVYGNNLFNRTTWQTLAGLPPGKHQLRIRLDSSAPVVEGVPLAMATLPLEITAAGIEAWKRQTPDLDKAFFARGGELVRTGRILEAGDFKLVASPHAVRVGYRSGRFEGNDFYIGIFHAGKRMSDAYTPDGGMSCFVRRGEGGYEVVRAGTVLARFGYDGTVSDRTGKPWGKVVNEWDQILGVGDLLPFVAGLVHFGTLLK